ncbi:MAG: exosortase [Bryobacteraceae bacterium]
MTGTLKRAPRWVLLPLGIAVFWAAHRLSSQSSPANPISMPPSVGFLIGLGIGDKTPKAWDGSVTVIDTGVAPSVIANAVVDIEGWRFFAGDSTDHRSTWKLGTRYAPGIPPTPPGQIAENGVTVYVRETAPNYQLQVKTAGGNFSFRGSDVPYGTVQAFLNGAATVRRVPGVVQLTESLDEQDMPALSQGRGANTDDVWLTYTEFVHGGGSHAPPQTMNQPIAFSRLNAPVGGDQVLLMHYSKSARVWTGPFPVSASGQDIFRTAVAVDGSGTVWIFWSANQKSNFDIYARSYSRGAFSPETRITTDPGTDLCPVAATDAGGRVWVAWQGYRNGNLEILTAVQQPSGFSPETIVSTSPASDWEPSIAAAASGDVAIAWDTYDKGDYDVYYRRLRLKSGGMRMDDPVPVSASRSFEARSSVAFDPRDRLWVAHETAAPRWGKNFGAYESTGASLYLSHTISVKIFDGNRVLTPSAGLGLALPLEPGLNPLEAARPSAAAGYFQPDPGLAPGRPRGDSLTLPNSPRNSSPVLSIGPDGIVYLAYRVPSGISSSPAVMAGPVWIQGLVYFDGSKWSRPLLLTHSDGRLDYRPGVVPVAGGLMIATATDHRLSPIPGQTPAQGDGVNADIYAMELKVDAKALSEDFAPVPESLAAAEPDAATEAAQVGALRSATAMGNGRALKLMRGEFHRHTEISFDGARDGSLEDAYRYLIDAAALDWSGCCDHDNGSGREYNWWLEQKYNDAYKLGAQFVPMFSYERSVEYPEGHRNILFAQRGVRPLPRLPRSAVLSSAPAPDTLMLYSYLKVFKGISAPHTSATNFGTDWRNNDPSVETSVEIYQGHRQSYEMPGAPRAIGPEDAIGGYEPNGFVSEALQKGYRLGFHASSDHISTHIAFCNLWVENPTRQGILNAFRRRHVYGATDNILADVRSGTHFMGDEFSTGELPTLSVKLRGTGNFSRVLVVKDGAAVYSAAPGSPQVDFTWTDLAAVKDKTSYYYIRGEQSSGDLVWASRCGFTTNNRPFQEYESRLSPDAMMAKSGMSPVLTGSREDRKGSLFSWIAIAWFGGLLVVCYAPVLFALVRNWNEDQDMSHGFFVPVIAGYIAWRKKDELAGKIPRPNWWGLAIVLYAAVQLYLATLGAELFLARTAFIFSLIGMVLLLGGREYLRIFAFPLFLLFLMVPIPAIIYNRLTFPLQIFASQAAESALGILHIPVLREGNILELSEGQRLSVVEACSGIRSLLTLSFLSLVYGYFSEKKTWIRVALFFSTIPIAIVANASRVTLTGVLSEYKPELAEGFFHSASGWVIFMVALTIMVGVHQLLVRGYSYVHGRR